MNGKLEPALCVDRRATHKVVNHVDNQHCVDDPTHPTPRTGQIDLDRLVHQVNGEKSSEDHQSVVDHRNWGAEILDPDGSKGNEQIPHDSKQRHRDPGCEQHSVLRPFRMACGTHPCYKSTEDTNYTDYGNTLKVVIHGINPPNW